MSAHFNVTIQQYRLVWRSAVYLLFNIYMYKQRNKVRNTVFKPSLKPWCLAHLMQNIVMCILLFLGVLYIPYCARYSNLVDSFCFVRFWSSFIISPFIFYFNFCAHAKISSLMPRPKYHTLFVIVIIPGWPSECIFCLIHY